MVAKSKALTDPVRRCAHAEDGSITVCGSDTERDRLSPELRAIAGIGKSTRDNIPHAAVPTMTLDRLPYNWVRIGRGYPPGPAYDPLYELAKKVTDPDREDAAAAPRP